MERFKYGRYFFLVLILEIFFNTEIVYAKVEEVKPEKNCKIHIEFLLKNGEVTTSDYSSLEKNKKACAKVAKLHEENFAPQAVKKKKVTYSWVGKNEKK